MADIYWLAETLITSDHLSECCDTIMTAYGRTYEEKGWNNTEYVLFSSLAMINLLCHYETQSFF